MLALVLALMAAMMVAPMVAPVAAGGEEGALMMTEGPYGLEPVSDLLLEQTSVVNAPANARVDPYGFGQFSDLALGQNFAGHPIVDMAVAPYGPEHIILSTEIGFRQPVYYPLLCP